MAEQSNDEMLDMVAGRYYGKYRGVVTGNQDPMGRGRLEVQVPSVMGEETLWALPCVAYAGPGVGTYFIPPIDARVWVEFEGGDISYPIWAGCYWGDNEAPATGPGIKVIKTQKFTIRIDDTLGILTIENELGTRFEIDNLKITASATAQIIQQVQLMKTTLDVTKFDVHDGAMSIS